VIAVTWQLGTLVLLGYGIDPLGLLVPFLIFAIGVSHGVQKISAIGDAAFAGLNSKAAARRTFRQLLVPAMVALLADLVGFLTILLIPVQVIREMATTASVGVAMPGAVASARCRSEGPMSGRQANRSHGGRGSRFARARRARCWSMP